MNKRFRSVITNPEVLYHFAYVAMSGLGIAVNPLFYSVLVSIWDYTVFMGSLHFSKVHWSLQSTKAINQDATCICEC